MINYVLERQVKSTNELISRLIEERDGKNLLIHESCIEREGVNKQNLKFTPFKNS
jgi:hypothetical protein